MEASPVEATPSRLALSVAETAARLGVSRRTVYAAIRDGSLPSLKLRDRVLVPVAGLERILEGWPR